MVERILLFAFLGFVLAAAFVVIKLQDKKMQLIESQAKEEPKYISPQLKELTQAQIDDIHMRGLITPEEMLKEWESLDLCAPGDAIGSASDRCRRFRGDCHDCLVDYANQHDEYEPIENYLKPISYMFDDKK